MEHERNTLIQSVDELVGIFEFYLLKHPQEVVKNVEKHLEKMGKEKALRWIANRMESQGLLLSEDFKRSICPNKAEEEKVKNTPNMGATPESEIRKYLNRKRASSRRYEYNIRN